MIGQMEDQWIKFRNRYGASKRSFYRGALSCIIIVVKILSKEENPIKRLEEFALELTDWVEKHP